MRCVSIPRLLIVVVLFAVFVVAFFILWSQLYASVPDLQPFFEMG